jgi:hypothetical protein
MSTSDIKERITQMTAEERDEIMDFLKSLQEDETFTLTPDETKEMERRLTEYESNPESAKPWQRVIGQWHSKA